MAIKNTAIVEELSLPPVKVHCSVLAEDAIKAAIKNYQEKQTGGRTGSRDAAAVTLTFRGDIDQHLRPLTGRSIHGDGDRTRNDRR